MTSGPFQPGQASLSIGGETIPFTMEAEVEYTTLEEAIASGLFDMPDEPGMIRIPVTINVMLPYHILFPPGLPAEEAVAGQADGVPPNADGGRAHTRFGNYPRSIAARNIARTFKTTDEEASERAEFRNLLDVMHPRRDQVASQPVADAVTQADAGARGAGPIKLVQLEAGETRLGSAESRLSPAEASRAEAFAEASSQLAVLEPGNPVLQRLTTPGSMPDDAAVEDVERELAAAEARAAVKSSPTEPSDLPLRSVSGEPSVEGQAGLPPLLEPSEPIGEPGDETEGFPQAPLASYKEGASDGGPGEWVADSPKYPRDPDHAGYQQRATGAPPGMEYQVPAPVRLKPSGVKLFDGYDPATGHLLDAKNYVDWPNETSIFP